MKKGHLYPRLLVVLKKTGKYVVILLTSLLVIFIVALLLLQTALVQNYAKDKIIAYLSVKLNTKISINRLAVSFPKLLVLDGFYLEDQHKDTLLFGNKLLVDINMLKLFSGEIKINEIALDGFVGKVARQNSDTTFNFQFIMDAFQPNQDKVVQDTGVLKFGISKIKLDRTRFEFKDVITGNDLSVAFKHFDARINSFDPTNLSFDVPSILMDGMTLTAHQTKPLTTGSGKAIIVDSAALPMGMLILNKEVLISNSDIKYTNDVSGISTAFKIKKVAVHPVKFDLSNSVVALRDIEMDKLDGYLTIEATTGKPNIVSPKNHEEAVAAFAGFPWIITVGNLSVGQTNFSFVDNNKAKVKSGMDYSHLDLQNFSLNANHFLLNKDTLALNISRAKMTEQSGFSLTDLQADIIYTDKETSLRKLFLKTPDSEIKRSLVLRYPSMAAMQKNIDLLEMEINIDNSYLAVKDMLTFMPALANNPAFKNKASKFFVNADVIGNLRKLAIKTFQFKGFQQTAIDVNGTVLNVLDPKKASGEFSINKFRTSRTDLITLLPKSIIPSTINLPETIEVQGTIKGGMNDALANLSINSSLGSASIKGSISNGMNKDASVYQADVFTNNLNIGAIIKQPQSMGKVTARFGVSGKGYNLNSAKVNLKGNIFLAEVMKYSYKNLGFEASVVNKQVVTKASIKDPNITIDLEAKGTIGEQLTDLSFIANIDSLNTGALHLTKEPIFMHGKFAANFPTLILDSLNGNVAFTNGIIVANGKRIVLDTISALAFFNNQQQSISIESGFMNGEMVGKYRISQLGDIISKAVLPYIIFDSTLQTNSVAPYDVALQFNVIDHPILHGFFPALSRFDGLSLSSSLSSLQGVKFKALMPYVIYNDITLDSLVIASNSSSSGLDIVTSIESFKSGKSIEVFGTSLTANLTNRKIDFGLLINDRNAKPKYTLSGLINRNTEKNFSVSLLPDSLMLNYEPWKISNNNKIGLENNQIYISDFDLQNGVQHLVLNSPVGTANSPLSVSFNNFKLATLSAFVQSDSLLVNGTLNGNIEIRDLMTQPNFVSDLVLNNLSIKTDTVGNIGIKVNNIVKDVFAADISISGRGNEANLSGNYYLKPGGNSVMDMNFKIKALPLKSLESFSIGMIDSASGNLKGNVSVKGTIEQPQIKGNIDFNKTQFYVPMLGSVFAINNESIKIDNQGIAFDKFQVKDSANNFFILDGLAKTSNFIDYNFDLSIRANDFRAINTVKSKEGLYYGQLYFTTNMTLKGTSLAPVVDGKLIVNDRTNFTVVLPQREMNVVERKGIIEFVDMDLAATDSVFSNLLRRYDSTLNKSTITGMDVSVNIQIVKEANFNLVIDEANGDLVNLQGEAFLNGGIDPSGKITLTGTYELEKGGYELSFNFLRRRFDIKKGSKITWTGEPTTAEMDLTAVYIANTSAIDLVQNQINDDTKVYYQQKLPFQVLLMMKGEILKPILTFDIELPIENSARVSNDILLTVNARLDQIKQEPSELNKQVFALLLLNRFVSENPFQSSSSSGFNAASFARQSLSKILTDQLNRLAGDIITGVDISFDVNSADDFTTGERRDRTDFNVQVSKQLLNDRLKISVGSNYEIEGPQQSNGQGASTLVGNITVDYKLTQNGRYLVRGYRKNDFDAIIEGMVVETGLKFIIAVDYNKFKEIFKNNKKRKAAENKKLKSAEAKQTAKGTM